MFKLITNLFSFILLSFTLALNSALVASANALVKSSINKKTTTISNPDILKTKVITVPAPTTPVSAPIKTDSQLSNAPISSKTEIKIPAPATKTPVVPAPAPSKTLTKPPTPPKNPAKILPAPTKPPVLPKTKKLMGDTVTGNTFRPADIYKTCSEWQDCNLGVNSQAAWNVLAAPPYNLTGFYCDTFFTSDIAVGVARLYPTLYNTSICSGGFGRYGDASLNSANIVNIFSNNNLPLALDLGNISYDSSVSQFRVPVLNANYFTNLVSSPNCFDAQTQFWTPYQFTMFLNCQTDYLVGSRAACYIGTNQQCCYGNSADETCNYNNGALWSQLALLLSGVFPLANGTEFNSNNSAIFQPGIKLIESVCGTAPITPSSPCYLDILKLVNPSYAPLITDIQAGNLAKVIADTQTNNFNINTGNALNDFMKPLMYAVQATNPNALEIVQYLLTIPGININAVDSNQQTAIYYAQNSTNTPTIKTAMIQAITNAPLALDIAAGNEENVLNDINPKSGININYQGFKGLTPLMIAAQTTDQNISTTILNMIVDNPTMQHCIKDDNNLTAFNYAQKNSSANATLFIRILSTYQIICDAANPAITLAELQADVAAMGSLPDLEMQTRGVTALMNAAQSANPDALAIVQYLINTDTEIRDKFYEHPNFYIEDQQGHNALWYAENSLNTPAIKSEIINAIVAAMAIPAHSIPNGGSCYIEENCESNLICINNICAPLVTADGVTKCISTGPNSQGNCTAGLFCDTTSALCTLGINQPCNPNTNPNGLCNTYTGFICDSILKQCRAAKGEWCTLADPQGYCATGLTCSNQDTCVYSTTQQLIL